MLCGGAHHARFCNCIGAQSEHGAPRFHTLTYGTRTIQTDTVNSVIHIRVVFAWDATTRVTAVAVQIDNLVRKRWSVEVAVAHFSSDRVGERASGVWMVE